jgi:hypothetical protein
MIIAGAHGLRAAGISHFASGNSVVYHCYNTADDA